MAFQWPAFNGHDETLIISGESQTKWCVLSFLFFVLSRFPLVFEWGLTGE